MGGKTRTESGGSDWSDYFQEVNERPVDDISLELFYKPHSITLLLLAIGTIIYMAFARDDDISQQGNIWAGLCCVIFFFLIISMLTFPNGPFIRPHPALWRVVFGLSVVYLLFMVFILFQDYSTVRSIIVFFFPELKNYTIDMDPDNWGKNCNPVTIGKVWDSLDIFASSHLFGWMVKALLLRHYGLLWTISVQWEITELLFAHLLPNFVECWWDAIFLDIILCNGLGIYIGMQLCRWLEMRHYKWESIKDISSATGKVKRALLQFTPESFSHVHWMDPACSYMRVIAVSLLVILWQLTELNTFFLKHIFQLPANNLFNPIRILFIGSTVAPTIRQYYSYVTDKRCRRIGTQCWVYICITLTEALVCFKFGRELFKQTVVTNVLAWLAVQMLVSCVCVYVCVLWNQRCAAAARYAAHDSGLDLNSSMLDSPVSSVENSPAASARYLTRTSLRHRANRGDGPSESATDSPIRRSIRLGTVGSEH